MTNTQKNMQHELLHGVSLAKIMDNTYRRYRIGGLVGDDTNKMFFK